MDDQAYTLAMYRVKPGQEDQFIRVWQELADAFSSQPDPPVWGTLIRGVSDRTLFYCFGPWRSAAHVRAMRENSAAGAAFGKLQTLCEEMAPGDYELVTHVEVSDRART